MRDQQCLPGRQAENESLMAAASIVIGKNAADGPTARYLLAGVELSRALPGDSPRRLRWLGRTVPGSGRLLECVVQNAESQDDYKQPFQKFTVRDTRSRLCAIRACETYTLRSSRA